MSSVPPTPVGDEASVRPLVATVVSNRGPWLFGIALVGCGALLFYTLNSRREALAAPSITMPSDRSAGFMAAPPELDVSSHYDTGEPSRSPWVQPMPRPAGTPGASLGPPMRQIANPGRTTEGYQPAANPPGYYDAPTYSGSQGMVAAQASYMPAATTPSAPEPPEIEESPGPANGKERVQATRFANPGTTVPKGTVVQAVLETALDSNRPGFARAIVSRDVLAFDGSRVLIPRGSRILGEYKSDIALGQNRILIQWQRLMRPDGTVINMDSPSADPLGRAGVRGEVDTHFFQRFAGAILQSALDVGVQLATREVSEGSIYIGLPGVAQGVVPPPEKIAPTVTVRQGASVSVFVARDLDFTTVNP